MSDTPRTDAEEWITRVEVDDPVHGLRVLDVRVVDADSARELERELAAAIKQRDEAQRDAERYRWLKSAGCQWITIYRHPSGDECFDGKGDSRLDERIDAARARDEKGGGA